MNDELFSSGLTFLIIIFSAYSVFDNKDGKLYELPLPQNHGCENSAFSLRAVSSLISFNFVQDNDCSLNADNFCDSWHI